VAFAGYPVVADSLLYGGCIAVVPQAWFAWRVFQYRGARSAAQIARASYAGEVAKFVLTVSGFAAVFALARPITGWAVFAGYGEMLVIQILGSWWLLK
jgi:ATP synthase protein I